MADRDGSRPLLPAAMPSATCRAQFPPRDSVFQTFGRRVDGCARLIRRNSICLVDLRSSRGLRWSGIPARAVTAGELIPQTLFLGS